MDSKKEEKTPFRGYVLGILVVRSRYTWSCNETRAIPSFRGKYAVNRNIGKCSLSNGKVPSIQCQIKEILEVKFSELSMSIDWRRE